MTPFVIGILLLPVLHLGECNNCSMTNPCLDELRGGQPFEKPLQVYSNETKWDFDLHVNITKINYGWLELYRRSYNGKLAGPTWRVKKGDQVTVRLHNHLSADGNENIKNETNGHNYPNSTNLHTHGLHISGEAPQDDVLISVEPGETFTYKYEIYHLQASGTNWYHAHRHMSTMFQVHSGMSGLLIVEDDESITPKELFDVSCPNNCDKDIEMNFQPVLQLAGKRGFIAQQRKIRDYEGFRLDNITIKAGGTLVQWMEKHEIARFTTNGQFRPVLTMQTGQMYRFRMVNAGGDGAFGLHVIDEHKNTTSHCEYREISTDGIYLNKPRAPHRGRTFIVPGQRSDWLIKCNKKGIYRLQSTSKDEDSQSVGELPTYTGTLVTLNVTGNIPSTAQDFPNWLPQKPEYLDDLRNIDLETIENHYILQLDSDIMLNGRLWDHKVVHAMKLNTIQEWHIINTNPGLSHPIHIHINHHQVISFNEYKNGGVSIGDEMRPQKNRLDALDTPCFYGGNLETVQRNTSVDYLKYLGHAKRYDEDGPGTIGYSRIADWRDTILSPPLSNITIRFRTDHFTGIKIIHCHILEHEDSGMMMLHKILPEDKFKPVQFNYTKGENPSYPGVCGKCDRFPFNNPKTLCDTDGSNAQSAAFSITTFLPVALVGMMLK